MKQALKKYLPKNRVQNSSAPELRQCEASANWPQVLSNANENHHLSMKLRIDFGLNDPFLQSRSPHDGTQLSPPLQRNMLTWCDPCWYSVTLHVVVTRETVVNSCSTYVNSITIKPLDAPSAVFALLWSCLSAASSLTPEIVLSFTCVIVLSRNLRALLAIDCRTKVCLLKYHIFFSLSNNRPLVSWMFRLGNGRKYAIIELRLVNSFNFFFRLKYRKELSISYTYLGVF